MYKLRKSNGTGKDPQFFLSASDRYNRRYHKQFHSMLIGMACGSATYDKMIRRTKYAIHMRRCDGYVSRPYRYDPC